MRLKTKYQNIILKQDYPIININSDKFTKFIMNNECYPKVAFRG